MRDLERYPDQNPNVVIFDENGPIYGHKILRRIAESGESSEEPVIVRGIPIDVFVSYLQVHFPNYRAVTVLQGTDQMTPSIWKRFPRRYR